jgi:Tfp pilus assembly protein PilX
VLLHLAAAVLLLLLLLLLLPLLLLLALLLLLLYPPSGGSHLDLTAFLKLMDAAWRTAESTVGSAATRSRFTTCPCAASCCRGRRKGAVSACAGGVEVGGGG